MEQEVVFDNELVQNHHMAHSFLTTLSEIAVRDYEDTCGIPDGISALDLDTYEAHQKRQPGRTIDAAIGIAKLNQSNGKISNQRLLLVELRLGYKDQARNCDFKEMKEKEDNSRLILSDSNVDELCFFLFNKNTAPKVKSRLSRERFASKSYRDWRITTVDGFLEFCAFAEDLPYTPVSPVMQMKEHALKLIANSDSNALIDFIKHWLEQEESFYKRYQLKECDAILKVLDEVLLSTDGLYSACSEETRFDYELAKESYQKKRMRLSYINLH